MLFREMIGQNARSSILEISVVDHSVDINEFKYSILSRKAIVDKYSKVPITLFLFTRISPKKRGLNQIFFSKNDDFKRFKSDTTMSLEVVIFTHISKTSLDINPETVLVFVTLKSGRVLKSSQEVFLAEAILFLRYINCLTEFLPDKKKFKKKTKVYHQYLTGSTERDVINMWTEIVVKYRYRTILIEISPIMRAIYCISGTQAEDVNRKVCRPTALRTPL
ncbi:hypothetical protein AGLY_002247 [Aphis glycines]|uniref:Uncharacterized protein n=1 Tax=Aphis glycines TaxID=307491 RepID=A0A6G0U3B7_APHGL|nr:hypothetical protein AGLY_002247 [Aphis glycines]